MREPDLRSNGYTDEELGRHLTSAELRGFRELAKMNQELVEALNAARADLTRAEREYNHAAGHHATLNHRLTYVTQLIDNMLIDVKHEREVREQIAQEEAERAQAEADIRQWKGE